jgi:hypothetical protein
VLTRPLAGTRPRGADLAEDGRLRADLLADEKERAEHVMLVDLGRNDLGRVCTPGSVTVDELMEVENYSHVMHIVSNVTGTLAPDKTAFDALRATFPAGTVSGAPKIRAMEIIRELEPAARGPYAGTVGYVGLDGAMDMCITIRTFVIAGGRAYLQSGAGIVADSDPQREYEETLHKAKALHRALELAAGHAREPRRWRRDPRHRQLRLVHLQPRAAARRSRRRGAREAQRRAHGRGGARARPAGIVISPGPGTPPRRGSRKDVVRAAADAGIPLLGVCLGHQCIAEVFGGVVWRSPSPVHGKTDEVITTAPDCSPGCPSPFTATRYHSLCVDESSLPSRSR